MTPMCADTIAAAGKVGEGVEAADAADATGNALSRAEQWSRGSRVTAAVGTIASLPVDGAGCLGSGDKLACTGFALNGAALGLGAAGFFGAIPELYSGVAGAVGFGAGAGGLTTDIGAVLHASSDDSANLSTPTVRGTWNGEPVACQMCTGGEYLANAEPCADVRA